MKMRNRSRQSGLALVSAIILLVCILIIGGIVVKVLLRFCEKITPATPGNVDTNSITAISYPGVTATGTYQAALVFPALPAPTNQTAANPFGDARMEIERSTNLVDWITIAVVTNPPGDLDIMTLDANRPPDRAFYRGKFIFP